MKSDDTFQLSQEDNDSIDYILSDDNDDDGVEGVDGTEKSFSDGTDESVSDASDETSDVFKSGTKQALSTRFHHFHPVNSLFIIPFKKKIYGDFFFHPFVFQSGEKICKRGGTTHTHTQIHLFIYILLRGENKNTTHTAATCSDGVVVWGCGDGWGGVSNIG
eukprot:GHVR01094897.1.p1 GENE.GHVR01094897.1~~GHVR01094897.1.p1  ORF type:complete len:162 (-),score=47.38 GHVR01094897.1:134-619(-)